MGKTLALAAATATVTAALATGTAASSQATTVRVAAHTAATRAGPRAACKPHAVGKRWECITPGGFCPAAAKNLYGYPEKSKKRYQCSQYPDRRLRWKRA